METTIRKARDSLGLSQRQVIELVETACGLPIGTLKMRQRTLWRWENVITDGAASLGAVAMLAFLNTQVTDKMTDGEIAQIVDWLRNSKSDEWNGNALDRAAGCIELLADRVARLQRALDMHCALVTEAQR